MKRRPLTRAELEAIDRHQAECNARAVAALAEDMRTWPAAKIIGHHARPGWRTGSDAVPDDGPPQGHPAELAGEAPMTPPAGRQRRGRQRRGRQGRPIARGKL